MFSPEKIDKVKRYRFKKINIKKERNGKKG
jgi:hypothetical protein